VHTNVKRVAIAITQRGGGCTCEKEEEEERD